MADLHRLLSVHCCCRRVERSSIAVSGPGYRAGYGWRKPDAVLAYLSRYTHRMLSPTLDSSRTMNTGSFASARALADSPDANSIFQKIQPTKSQEQ